MSGDPGEFRQFEHRGWQTVVSQYDRHFGELTTQSVEPLLDAAGAAPGTRLLDVACGPGYVASAAARRGSTVAGIDFSKQMVDAARERHPQLNFSEGDAENLDFPDESFDAVVMNFGMLHLANPERAIVEAHRVLTIGGRYAFTVWDLPERSIGFGIILGAIRKHGNAEVPMPPAPPFFRFSDPEESRRVLTAAGFMNIQTQQIPQTWSLAEGVDAVDVFRTATVRTAALLEAQTPQVMQAIREEVESSLEPYRRSGTVELPMPSILTSALRPRP